MRYYGLFWGEFGADLVGVKYCSHTLLLHAWVSVRRARSHPEQASGALFNIIQLHNLHYPLCSLLGSHIAPYCTRA